MQLHKAIFCFATAVTTFVSCGDKQPKPEVSQENPIIGTWKLLDGTLIEKGDTVITDYTRGREAMKIITPTHFIFMQHDLRQGKDSAIFAAGGGRYDYDGTSYTEHLQYCNAREWEGHDFTFTMTINGDTLIQRGMEKIPAEGIDRLNIERYVKMK